MSSCEKITGTVLALRGKLVEVATTFNAVGLHKVAESINFRTKLIVDQASALTVPPPRPSLPQGEVFSMLDQQCAVLTAVAPEWVRLCESKESEYYTPETREKKAAQFATIKQLAEEIFSLSVRLSDEIEEAKK